MASLDIDNQRVNINRRPDEEYTTPIPLIGTILVTGGAGFIGGWFIRHMARKYTSSYKIICFDSLEYCASQNNFSMIQSSESFQFIKGDIRNIEDIRDVLKKYKVAIVVHLAAKSHVDISFEDPISSTETNVFGTQALLEACRECQSIQRFLHISTDEVYGQNNHIGLIQPFSEEHALNPTNPYAASKAAAEMIIKAYRISFQIPIIIVRCNNVFGPCQFPEKLIPKLIEKSMNGERMPIHGDGSHVRSFIFVSDAAEALDVILHRGKDGETYNVASHTQLRVIEVAAKIRAYFTKSSDNSSEYIERVKDRPFNDSMYWTSGYKLHQLGWRQRTTFDEGLRTTIEWYCANLKHFWVGAQI